MVKKMKLVGMAMLLGILSGQAYSGHVDEQCRESDRISCVDLTIGLEEVLEQLADEESIVFEDLADFLERLKDDEDLFKKVNDILVVKEGIHFKSVDEFFDAIRKCDLVSFVIFEIQEIAEEGANAKPKKI